MRAALLVTALAVGAQAAHRRQNVIEPYAPRTTTCPEQLVRKADSISDQEAAYIKSRKSKADGSLLEFLGNAWDCYTAELRDLPTIGIALSGGGAKGALSTLGVLRSLDGRENDGSSVGGVLQSASYITALSGGTIALSAVLTNDNGLPTKLYTDFFQTTEQNNFAPAIPFIRQIGYDVSNKTAAGYPASLLDVYGRIISYNFYAPNSTGDDGFTLSSLQGMPFFDNHEVALPFYVVSNSDVAKGQCTANLNSSGVVWEISPFEWGSYDTSVAAFYPTKYMGTSAGTPGQCTAGFDNIGFITASSSNILINATSCGTGNISTSSLNTLSNTIYLAFPADRLINPYGIVPNPFYQNSDAGAIRNQQTLYWADGGYGGAQVIPIDPLIQPERDIDVAILVDTQSSGSAAITNGASLYASYLAAQLKGLTKMPLVPTPQQFAAQNLSSRPSFFGCHDDSKTTMIYLPNTGATIPSAFQYTPEQVNFLFTAGYDQGTAANNTEWAGCLACGIMHKSPWGLPDECDGCLSKYCWTP